MTTAALTRQLRHGVLTTHIHKTHTHTHGPHKAYSPDKTHRPSVLQSIHSHVGTRHHSMEDKTVQPITRPLVMQRCGVTCLALEAGLCSLSSCFFDERCANSSTTISAKRRNSPCILLLHLRYATVLCFCSACPPPGLMHTASLISGSRVSRSVHALFSATVPRHVLHIYPVSQSPLLVVPPYSLLQFPASCYAPTPHCGLPVPGAIGLRPTAVSPMHLPLPTPTSRSLS